MWKSALFRFFPAYFSAYFFGSLRAPPPWEERGLFSFPGLPNKKLFSEYSPGFETNCKSTSKSERKTSHPPGSCFAQVLHAHQPRGLQRLRRPSGWPEICLSDPPSESRPSTSGGDYGGEGWPRFGLKVAIQLQSTMKSAKFSLIRIPLIWVRFFGEEKRSYFAGVFFGDVLG